MDKIKLKLPVIVEGKYDKAHLSSVVDAVIIPTSGFGVFKNEEKRTLIRTLGQNGIIMLCDSDGGGRIIRSRLRGMLDGIRVYDLYTPQIEGKERRKSSRSAEGYLGVEGIEVQRLYDLLSPFAEKNGEEIRTREEITKADMFACGLTGGEGSAEKRDELSARLDLPSKMNPNALLSALNVLLTREEFFELVNSPKI